MKTVQLQKYGGGEAIAITDTLKPSVSEGKILIEVYAAGINPVDWKIRAGYLQKFMPLNFPATLGGDVSGMVAELGSGVANFKIGDQVFGRASGSFAEFALADTNTVTYKPKAIDHTKAGALPLAGVSALQALTEHIHLHKSQNILIHGGAGGIGSIAIQIAKHLGAFVTSTASGKNVQYIKDLGADEVIDYTKQKFDDRIKNYDAVFDNVGGETYTRSFKALKKGGIIVSMLEQPNQELIKEYGVNAIGQFTQVTTERLTRLAELVNQGVIKVYVEKTFPLEQAAEALSYLEEKHPRGKIVLKIKDNK